MKVYTSPIEAEEIVELAKDHEYGDTWITVIIPFNFKDFVENRSLIDFEEEVSSTILPYQESVLHGIEYKLVGIQGDDYVLLEITADAKDIIEDYNEELDRSRRRFE